MLIDDNFLNSIKTRIKDKNDNIVDMQFIDISINYIQKVFYFSVDLNLLDIKEDFCFYSMKEEYIFTFNELNF